MYRIFDKPFHIFITLHFTTNSKIKARRKVLQFSSFLQYMWISQVVFVRLLFFLIIIIIVYFLHYDCQIMDYSVKPGQMRLSNWTPAETSTYQTISLVSFSATLLDLFRAPKYEVTKSCNLSYNCPCNQRYTCYRERGHLTATTSCSR